MVQPSIDQVVATNPTSNTEAEIVRRFGSEIPFNIGEMNDICQSCGALHWKLERTQGDTRKFQVSYSACCQKGAATPPIRYNSIDYPGLLRALLSGNDSLSTEFQHQIRGYNNALSFASCGASVDRSVQGQNGIYTFRVGGALFHDIGSVLPDGGNQPSFSQIYVVGGNDHQEASVRISQARSSLNEGLLFRLQQFMNGNNSYAQFYRSVRNHLDANPASNFVLRSIERPGMDLRVYNRPRVEEIAMVIDHDNPDQISPRDILLRKHSGRLLRITDDHTGYLPLWYPIFFPFGEQGWIRGWPSPSNRRNTISQCEWYAAMLFDHREQFSAILHGKNLFQELLVDLYICVERSRLNFYRFNQDLIRADIYSGVKESLRNELDVQGRRVILPSSFTGSPRNMIQLYQDSMACVRQFGPPSLFITMTANPRWIEIVRALSTHHVPSDRPDLVSRVFHMKLDSLIKDLVKNRRLGTVAAYVYTIEFQKRGLPHAHIIIILAPGSVPQTTDDIDSLVTAEIPDEHEEPELHRIVTRCMLHGPCHPGSMCWKDDGCSKGFPKPFQATTTFADNAYPNYRRRDNGRVFIKGRSVFNNGHVVPYNKYLSLRYDCHINVEIPYGITALKYLFKYITKGVDRSHMSMSDGDETKKFINGRYIGPSEAAWRLFQFPTSDRFPAIQRLALHLPNSNPVYFRNQDDLRVSMTNGSAARTTLTEFFRLNRLNAIGFGMPARGLFYQDFPKYFTWAHNRFTARKQRSEMIGRIYFASINEGERYFLRLLLLNRKGSTSFEDLRTVRGITYDTFRQAANELGLLVSDRHYHSCLADASLWMTGTGLRLTFVILLLHSPPSNPQNLFETFFEELSDDLLYRLKNVYRLRNPSPSDRRSLCFFYMDRLLAESGKRLSDVGITVADTSLWTRFENTPDPTEETSESLGSNFDSRRQQLNPDQEAILTTVIEKLDRFEGGLLYIDGPGGCGKTYLLNTISVYLKYWEIPFIMVASSGVASLMLNDGMTAHSRFKIPLQLETTSVCGLNPRSSFTATIINARVIIWDEISMQNKLAVEAVDRTLRDLTRINRPFGGKLIIFGGDFRQTLPVVKFGNIFDQARVCILDSPLWETVTTYRLTENLRLVTSDDADTQRASQEFYQWLLKIGNGAGQTSFTETVGLEYGKVVQKPIHNIVSNSLIHTIYENIDLFMRVATTEQVDSFYSSRLILTPLNSDVNDLNETCVRRFQGDHFDSVSIDQMMNEQDGEDSEESIPEEVLKSFFLPGFPESTIRLKVGIPIILLRNMNLKNGLSNGTRMVITDIKHNVLRCRILTGRCVGADVSIPKIKLIHEADKVYGVTFYRYQFPISVAFALTINKAQGQSLQRVAVFLPNPAFGHGQLYVALSRVTSVKGLTIGLVTDPSGPPVTTNVVNLDVLKKCHSSAVL